MMFSLAREVVLLKKITFNASRPHFPIRAEIEGFGTYHEVTPEYRSLQAEEYTNTCQQVTMNIIGTGAGAPVVV